MALQVNDAGTWKAATPWCNDAGTWKKPTKVWVNDAGTWKVAYTSAPTFSKVPGSYTAEGIDTISLSITCSEPAIWTWTRNNLTRNSATPTSGTSATTWTGTCNSIAPTKNNPATSANEVVFTVNANVGGVNYGPWSVDLLCDGAGF